MAPTAAAALRLAPAAAADLLSQGPAQALVLMLAINSVFHASAMAGCLGGRQRLAGAKPLDGHLSAKASQRLAGWGAANG